MKKMVGIYRPIPNNNYILPRNDMVIFNFPSFSRNSSWQQPTIDGEASRTPRHHLQLRHPAMKVVTKYKNSVPIDMSSQSISKLWEKRNNLIDIYTTIIRYQKNQHLKSSFSFSDSENTRG